MNKMFAVKHFLDAGKAINEIQSLGERMDQQQRILQKSMEFFSKYLSDNDRELLESLYGLYGKRRRTYQELSKDWKQGVAIIKHREEKIYLKICDLILPYYDEYVTRIKE